MHRDVTLLGEIMFERSMGFRLQLHEHQPVLFTAQRGGDSRRAGVVTQQIDIIRKRRVQIRTAAK